MKSLLLDAGNTRLKWALCEDGRLSQQGALRYEWLSIADQLDATLGKLLAEAGALTGVTLCNVAGEKLAAVLQQKLLTDWNENSAAGDELVKENAALTIKNILAQPEAYGVKCGYENSAKLGADRWAALVAARHYCSGASCIIDCGTALPVDVLAADGRPAGGVLIAGVEVLKCSLLINT